MNDAAAHLPASEYQLAHIAMSKAVADTLRTTVVALFLHGNQWVAETGPGVADAAFKNLSAGGLAEARDQLEHWETAVAFLLAEVRTRELA